MQGILPSNFHSTSKSATINIEINIQTMKNLTILSFSLLLLAACNSAPTDTPAEVSMESYTLEQVAEHGDQESCWTTIDGTVYDLTDWISKHPGGAGNILKICGIDGTETFRGQHGENQQQANVLEGYEIGTLE